MGKVVWGKSNQNLQYMTIVVATEEEKALIPQWAHGRIIVTGVGIANVWAALADIPPKRVNL